MAGNPAQLEALKKVGIYMYCFALNEQIRNIKNIESKWKRK